MMNSIVMENNRSGTLDWQLTSFLFETPPAIQGEAIIADLRSTTIEGYASATSVFPGESLDLKISLAPAGAYCFDVYRLGYYQGLGGRHLLHSGQLIGKTQPIPMESIERLRDCNWETSYTLQVPNEWVSGVYLVKLTREEPKRAQSYITFVVKRNGPADILVQVSDLTWQAYNKWPGMNSIYDDGTLHNWYEGTNVRVSFNRPYAKYCQIIDSPLSCGSGEFLLWEYPLAFWLEQEGYDVAYCSNLDLHLGTTLIEQSNVFISVGHDEYWSRQMFEHVTIARDQGVNIAFFSGNAIYHEIVVYDEQPDGAFRSFARKKRYSDEETLMGSTSYGPAYGDWIVTTPDHWLYEGTGLQLGDRIAGLIGWENHGAPFKQSDTLVVVAGQAANPSTVQEGYNKPVSWQHAAVIYEGAQQNIVFNAGTIWWVQGLSAPPGHIPAKGTYGRVQGPDARVQTMTKNFLSRCLNKDNH